MKTNDLKRGARIKLRNGWCATILDNKRGNIRMAEVEGYETEIGSVYAYDIEWAVNTAGEWEIVEHTPAQLSLRTSDWLKNL